MTASIISDICIVSKTNYANPFILKNKCLSAFLSGIPFPLASFPFFSFLHNIGRKFSEGRDRYPLETKYKTQIL